MQATPAPLSLSRLERLVAAGAHCEALDHLLDMLGAIDAVNGGLGGVELDDLASDGSDQDFTLVFCTRLASAIGRLPTAPDLTLARIEAAATRPIEFHFLPLGAVGLACMDLARGARLRLKSAVVHPEAPHDT